MQKRSIFSKPVFFVLFALICTALWGSAFPMVKLGYQLFEISQTGDKIFFAGVRFMLAGFVILLVTAIKSIKNGNGLSELKVPPNTRKWLLALALVQIAGNYYFYYIGLSNTQGSVASIINSCDTFLSVLVVPLFFKGDSLTKTKISGVIIGLAGIILVNFNGGLSAGFTLTGEGFILMSSLFSTFGIILNKKVATQVNPITATGYFLLAGGTVLLMTAVAMGGSLNIQSIKGDAVLVYLSCVSGIAFALWSSLLKVNDVSKTGIFKLMIPVFGNILSAMILHENIFSFVKIISVILVAGGIALVNVKMKEKDLIRTQ